MQSVLVLSVVIAAVFHVTFGVDYLKRMQEGCTESCSITNVGDADKKCETCCRNVLTQNAGRYAFTEYMNTGIVVQGLCLENDAKDGKFSCQCNRREDAQELMKQRADVLNKLIGVTLQAAQERCSVKDCKGPVYPKKSAEECITCCGVFKVDGAQKINGKCEVQEEQGKERKETKQQKEIRLEGKPGKCSCFVQ